MIDVGENNRFSNKIHPVELPKSDLELPDTSSIQSSTQQLHYRASDVPSWKQTFLLGFQQTMICFSGSLIAPYLVSEIACAGIATTALRVRLISSAFIVTGFSTLLQSAVGLRLLCSDEILNRVRFQISCSTRTFIHFSASFICICKSSGDEMQCYKFRYYPGRYLLGQDSYSMLFYEFLIY